MKSMLTANTVPNGIRILATSNNSDSTMEIYRIKTKDGFIHVRKDWSTEIKKNGQLEYFVYGKGYKRTKRFELIDVDLQSKKDALYIGEIASNYGDDIASYLCEHAFGCCTISARNWTPFFRYVYKIAKENFNEDDFDNISRDVVNNFRGFFGILDTPFLDEALSKLDSDYDCNECSYKGKNVSMAEYVQEKYGEPTMRLINLLLR
jgi:hypothetical protein